MNDYKPCEDCSTAEGLRILLATRDRELEFYKAHPSAYQNGNRCTRCGKWLDAITYAGAALCETCKDLPPKVEPAIVNLNNCQACGEWLGPENYDGICCECEEATCEGCGQLLDETDGHCPSCEPNLQNALDMAECSEADRVEAMQDLWKMSQELETVKAQLVSVTAERNATEKESLRFQRTIKEIEAEYRTAIAERDAAIADKQMYLTMFAEAKGQRTL